jgi:hypothetical protein
MFRMVSSGIRFNRLPDNEQASDISAMVLYPMGVTIPEIVIHGIKETPWGPRVGMYPQYWRPKQLKFSMKTGSHCNTGDPHRWIHLDSSR